MFIATDIVFPIPRSGRSDMCESLTRATKANVALLQSAERFGKWQAYKHLAPSGAKTHLTYIRSRILG